jgi:hypothetical protein
LLPAQPNPVEVEIVVPYYHVLPAQPNPVEVEIVTPLVSCVACTAS